MSDTPERLIDAGSWMDAASRGATVATTVGTAVVKDGWAAGGAWYLVEFVDGELAGRVVWLRDLTDATAEYRVDANDDGFLFNARDVTDPAVVSGGAWLPEHDGLVVRIV